MWDEEWYRQSNADLTDLDIDLWHHFLSYGIREGRAPNAHFDPAWYLASNEDLKGWTNSALEHYLLHGLDEGRNPSAHFNAAWYGIEYPESAEHPLAHYLRHGREQSFPTNEVADIINMQHAHVDLAVANEVAVDAPAIDVIVPVYRGFEDTKKCIASLFASGMSPIHNLIVINDCSPDPRITAYLRSVVSNGNVVLIENEENLGFVGSVDRGMKYSVNNDVVLLNSDTEVPPGWLDRLAWHAQSDSDIGTVTPFSNNATICSYPDIHGGSLPPGVSHTQIDTAFKKASARKSIEIPTGVGFAMYIKRACLEDVGYFDLDTFGKGYGEEVDFCLRATQKNWKHVLACDVFVYHVGEVSFGAKSPSRVSGERAVDERYPLYPQSVARFIRSNVTLKYVVAATRELFKLGPRPSVLFITHGLGGGTDKYIEEVIDVDSGHLNAVVLSNVPGGVQASFPSVPNHPKMLIGDDHFDDLAGFLRSFEFNKVSVQHTLGWRDRKLVDFLCDMRLSYEVMLHDYYMICPSINLIPRQGDALWMEPSNEIYDGCVGFTSNEVSTIGTWRRINGKVLTGAERVVAPSKDTAIRVGNCFPSVRITSIPHEKVNLDATVERLEPDSKPERIRVGLLGHMALHKGSEVFRDVALAARFLDIDFVLIGSYQEDVSWTLDCNVCIHGDYEDGELQKLISGYGIDVLWLPAVWHETYSYVLTHAINSGLPIVATQLGSFVERLETIENARLLPLGVSAETWISTFRDAVSLPRFVTTGPVPRISTGYGAKAAFHDWLSTQSQPRDIAVESTEAVPSRAPCVAVIPECNQDGSYSPCGFIRLILPLLQLHQTGRIEAFFIRPKELEDVDPDVIVTQRNAISTDDELDAVLRYQGDNRVPILFDLDDDLLTPVAAHDEAALLNPNVKRVSKLASAATKVTVSTEALKDRVSKMLKVETKIIQNQIAPQFCVPNSPYVDVEPPVRILYMGTMTHTADLQMILPDLERLHETYGSSVEIGIVGVTAEAGFPDFIQRVDIPHQVAGSYLRFMSWIRNTGRWHIGLGPLVKNSFNASKSAIKIADYLSIGALPVVSDYAEYATYDEDFVEKVDYRAGAWFETLSRFVEDPSRLKQKLEAGRNHLGRWAVSKSMINEWHASIREALDEHQL